MDEKRDIRLGCLAAIAAGGIALALTPVAGAAVPTAKRGPLAKVNSQLQQLLKDRAAGRDLVRLGRQRRLRVSRGGRVLVDVYVKGSVASAARQLRAEGMEVRATSARAPFRMAEGWLPVAAIPAVAKLTTTRGVLPVFAPNLNTGSVLSQGDAAHRGPAARSLGHNGAGVKVGVISDSFNQSGGGISDSGNNLPPSIQILSDFPGGSDEGRGMAEIIYDEAPGMTQLAFATGFTGPLEKAANMKALVDVGARVIADDISYFSEPFFQDGPIAQAADAARARGTAYFASAGNEGKQSWEGSFRATSCSVALVQGVCHDFGGGDDVQRLVTVPPGGTLDVFLQWDDAWSSATTDIDEYLVNVQTNTLLPGAIQGIDNNLATGTPLEGAEWTNQTASDVQVGIAIARFAGTRSPFMKHLDLDDFTGLNAFSIAEHNTASETISADAAASRGALAVGAVRYNRAGLNSPEPFSSRGPLVRRLFDKSGNRLGTPDLRRKPDIAAADGVSTAWIAPTPFYGTSASAPSAAGIAALVFSAKPSITVADVYAILRSPAATIDCLAPGNPDADCGYGFVLADAAMRMATDPSPPSITVNRTRPNGRRGWYVRKKKVNVSWSVSDSGSPVTSTSGCAPSTIDRDTRGTTLTCTAHSAGGNASKSVTIRRDSKRPRLSRVIAGKSFAVNKRGRASSAVRKGTRIRFRLSEKATATIKVQKRVRGRYRTVRTFKAKGKKGRNSVRFSGRIKRKRRRARALKAGRYRFRVQAADTAGNRSGVRTRKFRIRK